MMLLCSWFLLQEHSKIKKLVIAAGTAADEPRHFLTRQPGYGQPNLFIVDDKFSLQKENLIQVIINLGSKTLSQKILK